MKEKICAVVVTYNRKDLLVECLNALKNQTYPLDGIYIIDNASTDGTQELLMKEGWITEIVSNKSNEPIEIYKNTGDVSLYPQSIESWCIRRKGTWGRWRRIRFVIG